MEIPEQIETQPEVKAENIRRGIYILPNLITAGSLFAGFYSMVATLNGNYSSAAIWIFISAICDGLDGKVARHFIVNNERVSSKGGAHPQPAFAIAFKDAAYGFTTMQAGNKQLAFMQGIQDKHIQIKGNPALVMWFQGLMKYLKPKKKA